MKTMCVGQRPPTPQNFLKPLWEEVEPSTHVMMLVHVNCNTDSNSLLSLLICKKNSQILENWLIRNYKISRNLVL